MLAENPPSPGAVMKCDRCGCELDSRLARYWFFVLGLRGREMRGEPSPRPTRARRLVLCGPCGDRLDREVELFMLSRSKTTGLELVAATGTPE